MDKFTYRGINVSSTETDINTRLAKAWTANNRISAIWKSDLTDEIKRGLVDTTTWSLTKRMEKKLDGNYTRMPRAIVNKSCRQPPTKHQLYSPRLPVTKTIQVRRTRHVGHS